MIAVIFEVTPTAEGRGDYMTRAANLRAELDQIPGFLSVERFESLTEPGKLLSLSFFEDEEAVARWRNHAGHRAAQAAGQGGLFAQYRISVAQVTRRYSGPEGRGS
ncbi:MAG: antibiotic biosynthesis monooxygenase [Rhodobacterales bacterium]|nr:MAG: antibiotic biosynthesis monooxygenase [Rhodobacterales bacterium]